MVGHLRLKPIRTCAITTGRNPYQRIDDFAFKIIRIGRAVFGSRCDIIVYVVDFISMATIVTLHNASVTSARRPCAVLLFVAMCPHRSIAKCTRRLRRTHFITSRIRRKWPAAYRPDTGITTRVVLIPWCKNPS